MSSAFYPLGMKTYNNHLPQGGYKTWKGTGIFSNPVGVTASHIRPLTNLDPGNIFPTGFGLARPIKHYRKGRVIPYLSSVIVVNPENPAEYVESSLVQYNLNRLVKSSKGSSLGGGSGGRGLLNQMLDSPGAYLIKQNTPDEFNNEQLLDSTCKTCEGVGIVDNYYPNNTYLTNNPEPNTTNPPLCCNEERKARQRVLPASTKLKKNYYTTLQQYRQNRCQTYEQRVFNFQSNQATTKEAVLSNYPFVVESALDAAKPGSPLALLNYYFANCYPNGEIYESTEINLINRFILILKNQGILTEEEVIQFYTLNIITLTELYNYLNTLTPESTKEAALTIFLEFIYNPYYGVPIEGPSNPRGCKLVVYKPNNPQFAIQGAVSSSTRMLKLNVDTISTNAASFNKNSDGVKYTPNSLINSSNTNIPFILKNKASKCGNPPIFPFQNHKACYLNKTYATPNTPNILNQPTNFTNYQSAFPTNHYGQSPRYALM
jgi:hypothetical protein